MPEAVKRPSHSETIFGMLEVIAQRATCPRLHTAAAIVTHDSVVVATGYNGSIRGQPHCTEVGCLMSPADHCERTIHAELNAILNAARTGVSTLDKEMYSLYTPCMNCSKYIVQAGITLVVVSQHYENHPSVDFLKESGIRVGRFTK